MGRIKLQDLTLILFLLLVGPTKAQVTIGSEIEPVKGALLDLKEQDNTSGGITATKGLALPRIQLTDENMLYPMFETAPGSGIANSNYDTPEEKTSEDIMHTGLMVYNMDNCVFCGKGVYAWDGDQWQFIGARKRSAQVKEYTDARDGEIYLYRKFGDAGEWMLENLRYVPKEADGYYNYTHSAIINTDDYTSKNYAYCEGNEAPYIPENHPSADWISYKYKKNGLFYNWPAVINMGDGGGLETPDPGDIDQGQGQPNELTTGVRGICPQGWHVPSDKEWNDLEREIYNNAHLYSTYTEAEKNTWMPWDPDWETTRGDRPATAAEAHGKAMKSQCPPYRQEGIRYPGKSLTAEQGGFDALLAGFVSVTGVIQYGLYGRFWSSSTHNNTFAWPRTASSSVNGVNRHGTHKGYPNHVRCKKDE
ncbi:MAG: fibrobacter succinogenes major paralogous domain-containing protein [Prevotella sp.]|jgi:uncharacterized protein (TIGR02145 family)|nr:fibrobacter succinogenes major paralogous domain-containing protein [Prevotella sp.]